jgi:hypothetical protein
MQIRDTPAPLPDDVPADVRRLIESAMVKDPADRFPDAGAFRDAIDDVLAGRPLRQTVPHARTAIMPAVTPAGGTAEPPATRTMPAVTPGQELAPGPEPDPAEEQREHRRRWRILVPLVALLAIAAVVVGGLQLAGSTSDAGGWWTSSPPTTWAGRCPRCRRS